ncbi:MAG: bifunctional diaminohydroxyphosphoribosylaminopyrimidine deaminase/5-amino-6-(5-phosphoribosylamino)uracil reductase RibD [Flavobacteriales bacterium]|nr:bifunctional diaminohydroxyphosphoribosylaminopyrimidine deaminase/5-amino-6-(5-phosphoribosylamino)uracil reductase RibD [Flavobacteriales bacterium]
MESEINYIKRCIQLAEHGLGNVAPNPMVGCVIVHDGKIIGEGFHIEFGGAHAEVNAINSVQDQTLLSSSTLYVNLEPCAHHGKTPPCVELILEKKIPRVVVSNVDPNPLVAGKGLQKLRESGVEVMGGICEEEGAHLNRRFFTFHSRKRPYIILKWAQTLDGFLDKERSRSESGMNWITSPSAQPLVHLWRAQEQAILVGKNTVLNDNPLLTVRMVAGKNPLRIAIDSQLEIPSSSTIFSRDANTLIVNEKQELKSDHVEWIKIDFGSDVIGQLMTALHSRQIISLMVEGGAFTLEQFIKQNLWDEARVLTGNKAFGTGLKAPAFPFTPTSLERMGDDVLAVSWQ